MIPVIDLLKPYCEQYRKNCEIINEDFDAIYAKWENVKLDFEAKLATDISSPLRESMLERLNHLKTSIDAVMLRLDANRTYMRKNFRRFVPNAGEATYKRYTASIVTKDIDLLQAKVEQIKPIQFNGLPYEFQSRIVSLLPLSDVATFEKCGETVSRFVKRRIVPVDSLFVGKNDAEMEAKKQWMNSVEFLFIEELLKANDYYVKNELYLRMDSVAAYDHAVKIISGDYSKLTLKGHYTWQHAIRLMNVSKNLIDVRLCKGLEIEIEDFDKFFEAVVQWLQSRLEPEAVTLSISSVLNHEPLQDRLLEYVGSRTNFWVFQTPAWAVVMEPERAQ